MVLLLTETEIDEIVDMNDSIDCLESVFREQGEGRIVQPDRQVLKTDKNPQAVVRIMSAALPNLQALGLKALLGAPASRKIGSTYFLTLLFDPDDSSLIGILPSNRLTQLRTGAASAIATKYLCRPGSSNVGIVGAGIQGFGQLEALAAVIQIKGVKVFDVDKEKLRTFAEKANASLGLDAASVSELDKLFASSDVVSTATTSSSPLVFGSYMKEGLHLNAIGSNAPNRQEIDGSALEISRVFVDSRYQVLNESGDLIIPIKKGSYNQDKIVGELCDVVTGKVDGRTSPQDRTLFKSVGIAIEDIAIARKTYEIAKKKGIGKEIEF